MEQGRKKKVRRLKMRNVVFFSLFLVFLSAFIYYLYQLPIKNIFIFGNTTISDMEIINATGIKNYPEIYRTNTAEMKDKMLELDYVKDVKISKNIFGTLTIKIIEEKPLFYNRNDEKMVFASGKEIIRQELKGVPVLINFVPDEIYKRLLKEMEKTSTDVLSLISEIEYQPWKNENIMIDETRFFLRMNDGNHVYVNLINWDKMNNYMTIYSTLGDAKGLLQLDSSLGNGITFTPF